MNDVKDFIEEKILPELEMIELFLKAYTIKNKILFKEEQENIVITPISNIPQTIYKKHYLFIQNTFLFYIILEKFL